MWLGLLTEIIFLEPGNNQIQNYVPSGLRLHHGEEIPPNGSGKELDEQEMVTQYPTIPLKGTNGYLTFFGVRG